MFLRHNYLGIVWAILILILSGLPSSEFPVAPHLKHFDKIVHLYLYAQFSLILIVGFKKQYRFVKLSRRPISYSFIFTVVYGITMEILQKIIFKGRSLEITDLLANFSGTILGILIFLAIYGKSSKYYF